MATEAQINANRENARKSTGPRTDEGKARCSQNAFRHGLTSEHLIVLPADREQFESLRNNLLVDVEPLQGLEMIAFNNLLHSAWQLHRIRMLERELFDGETDPLSSPELDARLDRLARYATRAERSYRRALNELRELQTNRVLRRVSEPVGDSAIPTLVVFEKLTKQTQTRSPQPPAPHHFPPYGREPYPARRSE